MGRPFFAPPGVPPERVAIMRRAFDAMSKDPTFLADAAAGGLGAAGISGKAVEALVKEVYATPQSVVAKAAEASRTK
jgi:tripartite-type tricarboxylate transporter receptor subunit TctC